MSSYRDSHKSKGDDYHAMFSRPRESMIWEMEREFLEDVVERYFPSAPPSHLDFACGTGRILGHLRPNVSQSIGVDVSASMLDVASRISPTSELIEVDLTRADPLHGRRFDLITAFRFFPNAEPRLRLEAMTALTGLLADRGILVFNNHMNANSLTTKLVRLKGSDPGHKMSAVEVDALLRSSQLKVLEVRGFGFLPSRPARLQQSRVFRRLERGARRLRATHQHCDDLVYVVGSAG